MQASLFTWYELEMTRQLSFYLCDAMYNCGICCRKVSACHDPILHQNSLTCH